MGGKVEKSHFVVHDHKSNAYFWHEKGGEGLDTKDFTKLDKTTGYVCHNLGFFPFAPNLRTFISIFLITLSACYKNLHLNWCVYDKNMWSINLIL